MTAAADWEATLDAFEARLAAQWAAFHEGGVDPVPPFEPPSDTAALPHHLTERASELVWRCRALEDALTEALRDAEERLERLGDSEAARPHPSHPVFFDSRV